MRAEELFHGCKATGYNRGADFSGITSDSRRACEGYLFICQRGIHHDGHAFAADALSRGAAAVLAEHEIEGVPRDKVIITPDARHDESLIWYNYYARPTDGMKKIAVTGTAGKTSVAFILRHIMRAAGHKVGMITTVKTVSGERELTLGTNGGSSVSDAAGAMTTPDPEYFFEAAAEMRDDGCDAIIYEASSQSLYYKKTCAICPDAAVFTNLSPEHLDCHGTMENYFQAKASLMESARVAVINGDDGYIARLPRMYPRTKCITCSAQLSKVSESDVCALRYSSRGADGIEFVYFSVGAVFWIVTPVIGEHSVYNIMQAAACAIELGVDPMTVKEALSDFPGVDGRLNRVALNKKTSMECGFAVFIDYAHTPDSLKSVLRALRDITEGELIVLFGCGGDRDRQKRPEMARAAQENADFVIITGDNPRTEAPGEIITDIVSGIDVGRPFAVIPDRTAAIKHAVNTAKAGDTILLAGKGHEKYEILEDGMHPYDEEKIAVDAVRERLHRYDNP